MKQLLIILAFFTTGSISAQIVNIPDVFFKTKLLEADVNNTTAKDLAGNFFKIDANSDGEIQESEALAVSYIEVKGIGLNVGETNIFSLVGIEAFTNLETLDCSYNNLNILDVTQNVNLKVLICGPSNDFYALTSLDVTALMDLQTLDCTGHELTNLDVTQNIELQELRFSRNLVTTIDLTNNINLQILECFSNDLISLDTSQHSDLLTLECSSNELTSLDVTQNLNLETLRFGLNDLTIIDVTQNVNLQDLYLTNNSLTTIDVTQNVNLQKLNFNSNQLTTLDVSQNVNLQELACTSNLLTILDLSKNRNLQSVICYDNPITRLFAKNGSDEDILLESAIPDFDIYTFEYICVDEFQVETIQALARPETQVNSYCSSIPEGNFNTISGSIIFDGDSNGCDASDSPHPNIKLNFNEDIRFSNTTGDYVFYSDAGSFEVVPEMENPSWFNVSPISTTIEFPDANNNSAVQDFCITPVGVENAVKIVISPIEPARPGFDAVYHILYENIGNQIQSGDFDITFNDDVLDFVSATTMPDAQTFGNLSWDYIDLLPFESRGVYVTLNLNSPMETPAVNIDFQLNFDVSVNASLDETIIADANFSYKQIVVGSYDPNDITCLEGDIVSPDEIGEYLHYNINFENIGTAAATFVVVKDVIDEASYDISSLQILYASHEMQTKIIDDIVEFRFDNINLGPNELGHIVFKIKTQSTLTVGSSVSNQAEIFFDYNFPIVTNIATTIFEVLSVDAFASDDPISVFPNPSKNLVTLASKGHLKSIQVYDAMARLVFEASIDAINYNLDISNYSKGIYFLKIKTVFGESVKRLIKN